jgi:hypothetical protein
VGPISVSIDSKKRLVGVGERFTLSGRVLAGIGCGRPWEVFVRKTSGAGVGRSLGSVRTGRYGSWHLDLTSRTTAVYTVEATGTGTCYEAGPEWWVEVAVRAKIKVADTASCGTRAVRGAVVPAQPGTHIYLEEKEGGRWTEAGVDLLDGLSRFEVHAPRCGLRYRLRWPAQGGSNRTGVHVFRLGV